MSGVTKQDLQEALNRHMARVCLDRFCACHGHTCTPPTLAAGETWICGNPKCRMVWSGHNVSEAPTWARGRLGGAPSYNTGHRG